MALRDRPHRWPNRARAVAPGRDPDRHRLEVSVALAARDELAKENLSARVVSMPCWELFAQQPVAYRESVLPPDRRRRVSIEAGVTMGWREWIGDRGIAIGIDRYGASAPGELILEKLGITPAAVVAAAKRVIASD